MNEFGPFVVHSQLGPQQGEPLGPLLFCLPLHSTLQSMRSRLRLGYLDDISLGGKVEDVQHDLAKVKELELSLGIRLNRNKCEYYSDAELLHKEFDGFRSDGDEVLMGSSTPAPRRRLQVQMLHRQLPIAPVPAPKSAAADENLCTA